MRILARKAHTSGPALCVLRWLKNKQPELRHGVRGEPASRRILERMGVCVKLAGISLASSVGIGSQYGAEGF